MTCVLELLADDTRVIVVPVLITDCPPLIPKADFHTTLIAAGSTHQSHLTFSTTLNVTNRSHDYHPLVKRNSIFNPNCLFLLCILNRCSVSMKINIFILLLQCSASNIDIACTKTIIDILIQQTYIHLSTTSW